jgi:CDP-4-dehydro-6-deoxyglucose reductase, E1
MDTSKKIRKEILKKVRDYYHAQNKAVSFVPSQTPVAYAGRVFDENEMVNLVDASLDFWLTTGRFADEFEKELALFVGVKHALFVNSGSSANLLAVAALTSPKLKNRLKAGDEVITTACGFPTTLNPILQVGAVPVFVDVTLGSYNAIPDQVRRAITKKTRAIVLAHTLGNPFDVEAIASLADKHGLWLIEDNCDALGASFGKQKTGTFGHLATLSFYPAHHMTTGEGGAVLTSEKTLSRIVASLRDWGRDCWCPPGKDDTCHKRFTWKLGHLPQGYDHKYIYSHVGYNLKATDMQAAVGCCQIKKLPAFIKARNNNFKFFLETLDRYRDWFILPESLPGARPSWFGFPLLVRPEAPFQRADIVNFLETRKIATRMLFAGNLTKQPAYAEMKFKAPFGLKNTDEVMNRLFWIGVYPGLRPEMRDYIAETFFCFAKSLHS